MALRYHYISSMKWSESDNIIFKKKLSLGQYSAQQKVVIVTTLTALK